jgi:hypothetical protein
VAFSQSERALYRYYTIENNTSGHTSSYIMKTVAQLGAAFVSARFQESARKVERKEYGPADDVSRVTCTIF